MIARGKYWKYCFCVKFATSSCQLFAKRLFPSVALEAKPTQATVTMVGIHILLGVRRAQKPLITGVNSHPIPLRQVSVLSLFYRWGKAMEILSGLLQTTQVSLAAKISGKGKILGLHRWEA